MAFTKSEIIAKFDETLDKNYERFSTSHKNETTLIFISYYPL